MQLERGGKKGTERVNIEGEHDNYVYVSYVEVFRGEGVKMAGGRGNGVKMEDSLKRWSFEI